jgi:hypothetical protein
VGLVLAPFLHHVALHGNVVNPDRGSISNAEEIGPSAQGYNDIRSLSAKFPKAVNQLICGSPPKRQSQTCWLDFQHRHRSDQRLAAPRTQMSHCPVYPTSLSGSFVKLAALSRDGVPMLHGIRTPVRPLWHFPLSNVPLTPSSPTVVAPAQALGAIGSATPAQLVAFAHPSLLSPTLRALDQALQKGFIVNSDQLLLLSWSLSLTQNSSPLPHASLFSPTAHAWSLRKGFIVNYPGVTATTWPHPEIASSFTKHQDRAPLLSKVQIAQS